MRSLVIANHGMGDVIMTLPLVRAVVSDAKDSALVVTKSAAEMEVVRMGVVGPGKLRCVALQDLPGGRMARFLTLIREARRHRPGVCFLSYYVHPWLGGILFLLSGAPRRIGPAAAAARFLFTDRLAWEPGGEWGRHKVEYACALARLVGRDPVPTVAIPLPEPEVYRLSLPLLPHSSGPLIAVALGSGTAERHKRLPFAAAARLVRRVCHEWPAARLVFLGTAAERELNSQLASVAGLRGWDLTGRTTPRQLLAVLRRCALAFTVCNGVSHMAAAAGCPVVGFFGPTDPRLTGPYGVPVVVITRNLPCSPCYGPGFTGGCGRAGCMEVDTEQAIAAAAPYISLPGSYHRERA